MEMAGIGGPSPEIVQIGISIDKTGMEKEEDRSMSAAGVRESATPESDFLESHRAMHVTVLTNIAAQTIV